MRRAELLSASEVSIEMSMRAVCTTFLKPRLARLSRKIWHLSGVQFERSRSWKRTGSCRGTAYQMVSESGLIHVTHSDCPEPLAECRKRFEAEKLEMLRHLLEDFVR